MPENDSIWFLEDVGEAPYRLDRAFTQLRTGGLFEGAKAIWLGDLGLSDAAEARALVGSFSVDAPCPVMTGAPAGHTGRLVPPRGRTCGDRLAEGAHACTVTLGWATVDWPEMHTASTRWRSHDGGAPIGLGASRGDRRRDFGILGITVQIRMANGVAPTPSLIWHHSPSHSRWVYIC